VRNISSQRALGHIEELRPTILVAVLPGFTFACLLGALLFAFAPNLSRILTSQGDPGTVSQYLRVFAIALPLATGARIILGATRGFGEMRPAAVIEMIIKPVSRVGLALLLFQVSPNVLSASMAWAIPVAVTFVLALAALRNLLRKETDRARGLRWLGPRRHIHKIGLGFWRFALPQSLSETLMVAVVWLDVILLGVFQSARQAGIYATLSRYLLVGEVALSAIALAIGPIISRLLASDEREDERNRAQSLYRFGTVWAAAIAFPLYLLIAVFAPALMHVFGASFLDGTDALVILSLGMLANIGAGPVVMVLLMGGRSDLILWDSAAAFTANMALNLLLIPAFGMSGAAIAWVVSVIGMNGLAIAQVRHVLHIHPFGWPLALITCSAMLSYGAVGLVVSHALGRTLGALAITCVIGSVGHCLVVWRMRSELGWSLLRASLQERRPRTASAYD
jgi:O-antigen/teichoic acid export membrane protein